MRMRHCIALLLFCAVLPWGATVSLPISAQEAAPAQDHPNGSIKLIDPIDSTRPLSERLEGRASLEAKETTLIRFAEELEEALHASVVLATKKLEESAISPQTTMTFNLRKVRLRTGLEHILSEIGLTYVIKEDVLQITPMSEIGCEGLSFRVYNCHSLLALPSPIKKMDYGPRPFVVGAGTLIPVGKPMKDAGPDGGYNIDDLTELLSITVDPDSWDDVGGPGSITEFKGLVVIYQTPTVHEKVEKLLNMLHQAGGIEGKVKVFR